MILIDPQCGVSGPALAGLFETIAKEPGAPDMRRNLVLPEAGDIHLVFETSREGLGTLVTIRSERDAAVLETLDMSEIEKILPEQKHFSPQAIQKTSALLLELAGYRKSAGRKPEFPSQTVLAVLVLFSTAERLKHRILSLPVGTGSGTRDFGGGPEPVPSSEVLAVAADYGVPIRGLSVEGATCDEAGFLFLAKTAQFTTRMPSVTPAAVVRAAEPGKSTIRGMIVKEEEQEELWLLEAALDDATGEEMGLAVEILQEVSLEAHIVQALGKKGRPLFLLRVLARDEQLDLVLERFFRDTPTIGVRYWPIGRCKMDRRVEKGELVIEGRHLPIRVKLSRLEDIVKGKAEWEDVGRLLKGRTPPESNKNGQL
ncbi:MAG: nickel insertion protein [Thermovirgaceae bacterium]